MLHFFTKSTPKYSPFCRKNAFFSLLNSVVNMSKPEKITRIRGNGIARNPRNLRKIVGMLRNLAGFGRLGGRPPQPGNRDCEAVSPRNRTRLAASRNFRNPATRRPKSRYQRSVPGHNFRNRGQPRPDGRKWLIGNGRCKQTGRQWKEVPGDLRETG